MNLLLFLDLTYNPGKNFKFYSLQGQHFKIFLIFTFNQGKVFLILPITRGGAHVYLVSIGSCPPPVSMRVLSCANCCIKVSERPYSLYIYIYIYIYILEKILMGVSSFSDRNLKFEWLN